MAMNEIMRERAKMVVAMEYIARQINDETVFAPWLSTGVADGDIEYGELDIDKIDESDLEYYIRDDNFCDLMTDFLECMKEAWKNGGLYCGMVTSKDLSDFRKED